MKGPIYLVCISCTEEPYDALRGQLELIYGQVISCFSLCLSWMVCHFSYSHIMCCSLRLVDVRLIFRSLEFGWQMLLILTKSVNRCFEKNPKFDMTPLLGGTDAVFSSLIHSFSWFVSFNHFVVVSSYNFLIFFDKRVAIF